MAAKSNPAAELAEKMAQTLQAQRDLGGDAYPLTLKRLAELADPSAADDLRAKAAKALAKNSQVVLAQKKSPDTLLALAEDVERLAESRLLLEWLLEQVCTPKAPASPIDKVVKKVDEPLRDPLQKALARQVQEGTLPATVGALTLKDKLHLYLQRMPPPANPVAELAETLMRGFRRRRAQGKGYPLSLRQLVDEDASGADPKLVKKALSAIGPISVIAKDYAAPAALAEDMDVLPGSPVVLDYALARVCTSKKRTATVEQLTAVLFSWAKQAFEDSLRRRLEDGTLPESVGTLTLGQETVLYRTALPPEGAMVLAAKMLSELRGRRAQGGDDYPATLPQLVQAAQPGAAAALVQKATAEKSFKAEAVLARTASSPLLLDFVLTAAAVPVVLKGDEDVLATSPALLRFMVASLRTDSNQALPATDLKKKLARPLQSAFAHAVHQSLTAGTLPAGIGVLRIKKKEHLFLLEDIGAAGPRAAAEPPPAVPEPVAATPEVEPPVSAPINFAADFEEAYGRLDRQKGGNDFVSLVDLRRALFYDRETFDAELKKLRRAGLFTLSTAEGRHGLSAEQQEAGIREEGTLLLSVSRKRN